MNLHTLDGDFDSIQAIIDPAYCTTHACVVIHFCDSTMYVVFLGRSESVQVLYRLFSMYVLPLEIQFSRGQNWDSIFSLLRQTNSYVNDVRFSYLALVQDKKNHVRFTGKCMLYSLCQLYPQFSMLFLFKINNSLYISFQSFINMQILTISHIIT